MKNLFLVLFLIHFSSYANNCNNAVKEIYQNIITSIGNNSLYPPELHFSDETRSVAYMSSKGITIEQKTIDLFCGEDNFEDKIAYIIAHELAHYYLEHSWTSNTGLSYASSIGEFLEGSSIEDLLKTKKRNESQADLYAGFYGQIAGYNTLGFGEIALTEVYESYKLPKELKGYPSFDERIEILNSRIKKANDLALLFELGNVLLLSKQYNLAKECYEAILKNKFNSREIYNNLGLAFLLYGISISDNNISEILYPVSLDFDTRAFVNKTRNGSFFDNPIKMIEKGKSFFNRSIELDVNYQKARQNIYVSNLIIENTSKGRKKIIEEIKLSDFEEKIKFDFRVIYNLLEKKSKRKIKKLAKKGSFRSNINLSKNEIIEEKIDFSDVINKLDIDDFQLFISSESKNIKLPYIDISLMRINSHEIFKFKNTFVIRISEKKLSNIFKNEEKKLFIKTSKGWYYVSKYF